MPGKNWEQTLADRRAGLVPGFGAYDRRQEAEAAAAKKATAKKSPAKKTSAKKSPAKKATAKKGS